jgi:hypothetical protein
MYGALAGEKERERERERECVKESVCERKEINIGRICEKEMEEYECVIWHTKEKTDESVRVKKKVKEREREKRDVVCFSGKKALRGKIPKREYDNYDRVRFIQSLRRSFIFLVAFRTI